MQRARLSDGGGNDVANVGGLRGSVRRLSGGGACRTADDLRRAVDKVNSRRGGGSGSAGPAAMLERTLDNQLSALRELDRGTREVEERLAALGTAGVR